MPRRPQNKIFEPDALAFANDVVEVVARRSLLMGRGGRVGLAEAQSMVSEKVAAFTHVNWKVVQGSYGFTPRSIARGIFDHYATIVRANRTRLSK